MMSGGRTVRRSQSEKKDKKLADDARLLRWWKAWHREQREAVLAGPHGAVLGELFRMLENLQHVQPSQLIGLVRAIDWAVIDTDTKLTTLHELNAAITKFREKRGLEPIDDALPGEPDTPFRTIKAILFPASPHCEGAHRGEARSEYP
jgi:hypothetical protein